MILSQLTAYDDYLAKNCRIVEVANVQETITAIRSIELDSITGYADVPLSSLTKACASLDSIIYNLWFYVQIAINETPEEPSNGLSETS